MPGTQSTNNSGAKSTPSTVTASQGAGSWTQTGRRLLLNDAVIDAVIDAVHSWGNTGIGGAGTPPGNTAGLEASPGRATWVAGTTTNRNPLSARGGVLVRGRWRIHGMGKYPGEICTRYNRKIRLEIDAMQ